MFEITKEVKSVLKNTDTLCIHIERYGEKTSVKLRFLKNNSKMSLGFSETQYEYLNDYSIGLKQGYKAYFYIDYCQLGLLKHILKPGYEISFSVFANNNSGYLEKAGLHNDCLFLSVRKQNGQFLFDRILIDYSICPDNLARAVQRI